MSDTDLLITKRVLETFVKRPTYSGLPSDMNAEQAIRLLEHDLGRWSALQAVMNELTRRSTRDGTD